jgi:tetratricopeptide (TPR) repeat protein
MMMILMLLVMSWASPFREGSKAYEERRYRDAIDWFQRSIAAQEHVTFAWFNMGHALMQLEVFHSALVAYHRALEESPDFLRARESLGDLYFLLGEPHLAIVQYTRLLEAGDSSITLLQKLAESCWQSGGKGQALIWQHKVLQKEPYNRHSLFRMAEWYRDLADYTAARDLIEGPIRSLGDTPPVLFFLAEIYGALKDEDRQIEALRYGLYLNPQADAHRRMLASLYWDRGWYDESIDLIKRGLLTSQNPASFTSLLQNLKKQLGNP